MFSWQCNCHAAKSAVLQNITAADIIMAIDDVVPSTSPDRATEEEAMMTAAIGKNVGVYA